MALEITNVDDCSGSKIIVMIKDAHIYVAVREKTSFVFVPMISSREHKYKGKNLKACVKNALTNGERVIQGESYREIYESLKR